MNCLLVCVRVCGALYAAMCVNLFEYVQTVLHFARLYCGIIVLCTCPETNTGPLNTLEEALIPRKALHQWRVS